MVEIIPAIIPKKFAELEEKMSIVAGLAPLVQIDVMDGIFVPEKSWPYERMPDPDFAAILKEEREFPFWQELDFEVDLMVRNPERAWRDWLIAGAKRIIVHFESSENPAALLSAMKEKLPASGSFLYTEIGLALNVLTPNEKIYPFLGVADFIQFMGIAKIGFQGEPLDERVFKKIADLRQKSADATISVDGGVSTENAKKLVSAGANRLVAGSAIFESDSVADALKNFHDITLNI